jgi:putative endonuclease
MPTGRSKTIGRRGEDLAAEHFIRLGYRILGSGDWRDNLHERKRRQVRTMAAAWLNEVTERPRYAELRFDAVGVTLDEHDELVRLDHLQAAF